MKKLRLYTLFHFLVDLACIFKMCSAVRPQADSLESWIVLGVLYNFLAFALPALMGLIADFVKADLLIAAIGCVLTGAAGLFSYPVLAVVLLAGIGNGLFHVGAGRRVLIEADGTYSPPGIFICSGALGVFLGTSFGGRFVHPMDYVFSGLLFCAAAVLFVLQRKETRPAAVNDAPGISKLLSPAVLLILIVVFLRSFYGFAVSYTWKNTFVLSLVFTLCVVAGKALGGITADRIGIWKTSFFSLAGAAVFVLFSAELPIFGFLSILLFNMTMPLTLTLIAERWKAYPGFSFGLLMMALFLGTLPDVLTHGKKLPVSGLCLVSAISLVLLLAAIRICRKEVETCRLK